MGGLGEGKKNWSPFVSLEVQMESGSQETWGAGCRPAHPSPPPPIQAPELQNRTLFDSTTCQGAGVLSASRTGQGARGWCGGPEPSPRRCPLYFLVLRPRADWRARCCQDGSARRPHVAPSSAQWLGPCPCRQPWKLHQVWSSLKSQCPITARPSLSRAFLPYPLHRLSYIVCFLY